MIGPVVIIDKSFLQSLNPLEVQELNLYFEPVCVPTLVSEIIADLQQPKPRPGRIPEAVVRALAQKMLTAQAVEPARMTRLVLSNLFAAPVPMAGQVPIDPSEPHVHVNGDGTGILIDSGPQRKMWERWAKGDFSDQDRETAAHWRSVIEGVDLESMRDEWRSLAQEVGNPRTLAEVITAVDGILADPSGLS
jgi:hypothetical protein